MSFVADLFNAIKRNNSQLCVGLDIDTSKLPQKFLKSEDPIFDFNRYIIENTRDYVCSYKPNMAFYEMYGTYGLEALIRTIELVHKNGLPVILDAKRGDIGNSSAAYAKAIFEVYKADATTVSPYMGHDSVKPFIDYHDKGIFVLCLTSNVGFRDFQISGADEPLYKSVAKHVKGWNTYGNCGLVVGATKPAELMEIREIAGNMPILIPGIGSQGGDIEKSVKAGGKYAIINASRSIIYAENPREEARKLRDEINKYR